jgi:hypothetical protein
MKRRYKLIIAIGVVCSIGIVAYFGYAAVRLMYELNRLEARRSLILYESDHQALLEACRELSRKVDAGQLKPGCYSLYGTPDPETKQFPQPILDLEPLQVIIEKNGQVNIFMWPSVMYGLIFFPDEDEDSLAEEPKDNYEGWRIELIDGLWYYDEDFLKHPKHIKEVEELLKKGTSNDSAERMQ